MQTLQTAEDQIMMDLVAEVEANGGGKTTAISQYASTKVGRQLECVRDELKCRELMRLAKSDQVVIALDNLRMLLAKERQSY